MKKNNEKAEETGRVLYTLFVNKNTFYTLAPNIPLFCKLCILFRYGAAAAAAKSLKSC